MPKDLGTRKARKSENFLDNLGHHVISCHYVKTGNPISEPCFKYSDVP